MARFTKSWRVFFFLLAIGVCAAAFGEEAEATPKPLPPAAASTDESDMRKRFLYEYQTAKTPELRAVAVRLLQGLKEQKSMRLITGMLGDSNDGVRQSACVVMSATPDSNGYFVKPLMGALTDNAAAVRISAAEALARQKIRGDAIKALLLALLNNTAAPQMDALSTAAVIQACDRALERLTGEKSKDRDSESLGRFWKSYWSQHEEEIRAEDKKHLAADDSRWGEEQWPGK